MAGRLQACKACSWLFLYDRVTITGNTLGTMEWHGLSFDFISVYQYRRIQHRPWPSPNQNDIRVFHGPKEMFRLEARDRHPGT